VGRAPEGGQEERNENPACPELADQATLWTLLQPERTLGRQVAAVNSIDALGFVLPATPSLALSRPAQAIR